MRKHGSNYLLETYLKGLSEAVNPEMDVITVDKNSDSGVMTEGDSEQSHNTNLKDSSCKNPEVTKNKQLNHQLVLTNLNSTDNQRQIFAFLRGVQPKPQR